MQRNVDYGESEIFQLKNPNRNSIVLSSHLLKWGMQDSGLEMLESEKFRICIWKSWSWIWSMDRDREPRVRKADFTKWTAIGQFVDFNTPYLPILTQTTINSWLLPLVTFFNGIFSIHDISSAKNWVLLVVAHYLKSLNLTIHSWLTNPTVWAFIKKRIIKILKWCMIHPTILKG